jgi:hypothetical protein
MVGRPETFDPDRQRTIWLLLCQNDGAGIAHVRPLVAIGLM